jgi:hypothetical protein
MEKTASEDITARIKEESATLSALISFHCQRKHGTKKGLCGECTALREYALGRLECCIFLPEKPTCARCPVHCYSPQKRQQIRQVMRYAAPRFYLFRPGLALKHLRHTFQRPSKKVQDLTEKLKNKEVAKTSPAVK